MKQKQRPLRKSFNVQPSFPFSFTFKDTKQLTQELPDHMHDWYELVYIYGGKGTIFIDRTIYEMKAGDIFIIPGNTIHRAFPDKNDPVTSTAMFFSPILIEPMPLDESFTNLHCFVQNRTTRNFKMECPESLKSFIEECLDKIAMELQDKKTGYRHAAVLYAQQILLAISRETVAAGQHKSRSSLIGPRWMTDILVYIDNHFHESIGLQLLCKHASVSPAHFSRVFKQLTGMNVTGYIAFKRIIRAKELLSKSEDNISNIAQLCGFESIPHFHRVFKQIVGVTPAAYRRSMEQE